MLRRLVLPALTATLLLGVTAVPAGAHGAFWDDDATIHEGAIQAIAEQGITTGCNPPLGARYCPDTAVPRDQMASFLARARGLETPAPTPDDHDLVIELHGGHVRVARPRQLRRVRRPGAPGTARAGRDGRRRWNIQQRILFQPVESGGDLHLWLTDDDVVGEQAPVCDDAYSCTDGDDAFVNDENFATATPSWDHRPLPEYQRYVIVHEVGHYLDFDGQTHYNDPADCAPTVAPRS